MSERRMSAAPRLVGLARPALSDEPWYGDERHPWP